MDQLLKDYVAQASLHSSTDLSSQASRKAGNDAADRLRALALQIRALGPQAVTTFGQLLLSEDPSLRSWVAHHLLELMQPDASLAESALAVIEKTAASNTLNAAGERLWLDNWRRSVRPT
jgi:hypothetical protein